MDKINPEKILSEEEKKACKESFDAYDKLGYGTLEVEELQKVLEELGEKPTKEELYKMISEVDKTNKGYIEFNDFMRAIAYYKMLEKESENDDTLEAFVAMGGSVDKSGNVDTAKLIQIVRDEFNMTIDIERLIHEIDHDKSGKISFDEFKALLSK
ncbi:dynein 18 kDa light chain (macronuclear) [Tetrahymena thermophila SB210]|uniref:Calmodulin n=2 Tax=Tetrahymena thermophila TaxID=5911 RepID=Q24C06_TETTS|nr:dynein 18 kDa light chain [Tetrahymena thermophila SB210]ABF50902.1 dynein light chain 4B [Tetrahymena thermophila]EAS05296.1 dynein 18 kDa light chain [Tetrahymena thermophila SB210]|eukprot:XP_001025541.1 dynein 18 kDa light chain [Tetrahymena thermophila SB210]